MAFYPSEKIGGGWQYKTLSLNIPKNTADTSVDLRDYGISVTDIAFIEAVAFYNQSGNNTWYINLDYDNSNWWVAILYQASLSRWVLRYKSPDDESLILKVYIKYR